MTGYKCQMMGSVVKGFRSLGIPYVYCHRMADFYLRLHKRTIGRTQEIIGSLFYKVLH